jgi:predicted RNase H-like HicB family nuclease
MLEFLEIDITYLYRNIQKLKDGTYVAYCPEIGFFTCSFCADTPEEALKGLDSALEEVINSLREGEKK